MTNSADEAGTTTPVPPNSILSRVRARREAIISTLWFEIPVPRWSDPEVWVRYGPVEHAIIRSVTTRPEKAQAKHKAETELHANEDVLIKACLGVYAIDGDKKVSLHPSGPDQEWTTFDPDLAETLGLPIDSSARTVLRAVYFEDGDIFSAAGEIAKFSGYEIADADRIVSGE